MQKKTTHNSKKTKQATHSDEEIPINIGKHPFFSVGLTWSFCIQFSAYLLKWYEPNLWDH